MDGLQLSPHIIVGPAMQVADREIFYLKDRLSGRYFRISGLEKSIIDCVQRGESMVAIVAHAAAQTGRAISVGSVTRLFETLLRRGILSHPAGTSESDPMDRSAPGGTHRDRVRIKGPFELYLRLWTPGRFVQPLAAVLRAVPDYVIVGLVLLCLSVELRGLVLHAPLVWHEVVRLALGPFTIGSTLFLILILMMSLLHELSHAVACARAGGQPGDIGVMFRHFMFAFYCQIDDLVVIPARRGRLTTILAGPLSHVFFALPFMIACMIIGPGAVGYGFCLAFVAANLALMVLNLIPFLQLDGYLLFSTGWKYPELRQEAKQALRGYFTDRRRDPVQRRPQRLLALYGLISQLFTVLTGVAAVGVWVLLCYEEPLIYGVPFVATVSGIVFHLIRKRITARGEPLH